MSRGPIHSAVMVTRTKNHSRAPSAVSFAPRLRRAAGPKLLAPLVERNDLLTNLPTVHYLGESAKLGHPARKREAALRWRRYRTGQRRNRNSRLSQVESGCQVPHIARCIA